MDYNLHRELSEAIALWRNEGSTEPSQSSSCCHEEIRSDTGEIICFLCGKVIDDFILENDIATCHDHVYLKPQIRYSRKRYFTKNKRYFKGFQNLRSKDDTMTALLIATQQPDPVKLSYLYKRLGLRNQIKNIPWMLSISSGLQEPLEGCINILYNKILTVYDNYKVNKRKFLPFKFTIRFLAKTLGLAIPMLAEQAEKVYKSIPGYKIASNEKRNSEVLVKCISGLNLAFLKQDIMNYLVSYRLTNLDDRLKYDVQQLDPGRALVELSRMKGIHDDIVYNPIDEASRKVALAVGPDLPLRLIGSENKQTELSVEGIATVDKKAPISIINKPQNPYQFVTPNAGEQPMMQTLPPEDVLPSNSAKALEIAKTRILQYEEQTKAYKDIMSTTRGLLKSKNK